PCQEIIKGLRDVPDGLPSLAEHEKEGLHLLHKEDPHVVEPVQLPGVHALCPAHPALLPFFPSPDAQSQTVVLQVVQLTPGKGGVAGPQKAEHAVAGKALPGHSKETADVLHKGVEEDAPL